MSRVECLPSFFFEIFCFRMYPAMAQITAETTTTVTIRPIATADNPSSWVVCLFVASSSVFLKVVVVPDDGIVVDEVEAEAEFVSRCFVVDTGVSDSELIVVLELEYIDCVVEEDVFSVEVVETIARGESVVCDNGYEDNMVNWDVDIGNVEVDDRGSIADDVDRGPMVEEDVGEAAEGFVVDIGVVSVLVQSNVQSNALDEAKHCQQLSLFLNVPL